MRELLFTVIYLCILYITGFSVKKIYNYGSIVNNISYGFIIHIAFIEVFGWWMVAFRLPMKYFMFVSLAVMLLFFCLGLKYISLSVSNTIYSIKGIKWYHALLVTIIIFECIQLLLFYRSDADDSFYVSNVLLFSQSDILNPYDSSFGNKVLGTVPMYDFQIWESYVAVFCKLFSIKATVMCHYILVIVLLIIAVSSELCLGEKLFTDRKKKYVFVCTLQLFYVMGGVCSLF